jgi:outer membrane protein assembly factor BamB
MLIVPNEQDGQSSLVALEAGTGKLRWSVPRESQTTYSTPCVYQSSGQPALLIFTNWNYGITAHDPATGMQLWQAKVFGPTQIETAIGSPIVAGDVIIGTCGWLGRDIHVVGVRPPRDEHPPQTVFHFSRGTPLSTTPLVLGDLLFMWSDGGIVTCADVQTGEVHWKERVGGTFYSSPVAAAGRIYNVSVDGQVVVLAGGKEFAELGRMELGEPANATPAIARDKMYLRTVSQLFCLPGK